MAHTRKYAAVLVGGGPAGMAVLLNAHRDGLLHPMLQQGLLIVERSARLGRGQIGNYAIHSDSTGSTFLDPLRSAKHPALRHLLDTPVARRIAAAGEGAVPLQDVGDLMEAIGDAIRVMVQQYPASRVLTGCTAQRATQSAAGTWLLDVRDEHGEPLPCETPRLVLATGATQPGSRLLHECVAGQSVQKRWGSKLVQSGEVLRIGGPEAVAARVHGNPEPRVAILGGSTSAVAVAHALLHRAPGLHVRTGGITLFHRKPLRVFYPSAAEALADGYNDFTAEDLCPVSGRVYRFAGLRLDSRDLLMQVLGVGGRAPEPRVALHRLGHGSDEEAVRRIDAADLVIAAFGYRPNALPLFNAAGQPLQLRSQTGPAAPLVDEACRVLGANGTPLPGVYGIGLAAGYRPRGQFGGEASFTGQVNGLWLWQNGIGGIIARALLEPLAASQRPVPAYAAVRSRKAPLSLDLAVGAA